MDHAKRLRRQARTLAVQALYLLEMREVPLAQAVRSAHRMGSRSTLEPEPAELEYAEGLVSAVARDREEIDRLISAAGTNWRLDRMAQLDAQILRVAVAELIARREDVPAAVAIDEAIEIAREFGGDRSPSFVNGVLDAVARAIEAKHASMGAGGGEGGR